MIIKNNIYIIKYNNCDTLRIAVMEHVLMSSLRRPRNTADFALNRLLLLPVRFLPLL